MKEGKFIDGISPEKEAEEAPYMEDWEGKRGPFLPLPWWEELNKDYLQSQILSKFFVNFILPFQKSVFKTLQEVVCFPNHNGKKIDFEASGISFSVNTTPSAAKSGIWIFTYASSAAGSWLL